MNIKNKPKGIILLQFNEDLSSRTFKKFQDRTTALSYVFDIYEEYLISSKKSKRPFVKIVDLSEIFKFFDSFHDFSYLEYDEVKEVYIAYGKEKFKDLMKNCLDSKFFH